MPCCATGQVKGSGGIFAAIFFSLWIPGIYVLRRRFRRRIMTGPAFPCEWRTDRMIFTLSLILGLAAVTLIGLTFIGIVIGKIKV